MKTAAPAACPEDPPSAVTVLSRLQAGQSAVIVAVRHEQAPTRQKYLARGLVPGAEVALVRCGDPLLVALDGCVWAIGREEARKIEVAALGSPVRRKWWQRLGRLPRPRGKADS